MKGNEGAKSIVDHNQAMWVELPKTGQLVRTLNENAVDIGGAIPTGQIGWFGPTSTDMPFPTPTPTPAPSEPQPQPLDAGDAPGRHVDEVSGIGPTYAGRLRKSGVESLAGLASAVAADVAQILGISEVKAMGFIDEAARLLQDT